MMKHVMLDLETWGTTPGCAIRSVGAVFFSPTGTSLGVDFYANISDESCDDIGMHQDESTVRWWRDQGPEAQRALLVDQRPLREVVEKFASWFEGHGGRYVWSHGAGFDVVLWEAACRFAERGPPWRFVDVRDTRTVLHIADISLRSVPREGTHHHALDDAKHQAVCIQKAYRELRESTPCT